MRREGSLDGGQASSVFYRPEKYDVLVYEPTIGEIRMHACGKGEKDLFRRQFGDFDVVVLEEGAHGAVGVDDLSHLVKGIAWQLLRVNAVDAQR